MGDAQPQRGRGDMRATGLTLVALLLLGGCSGGDGHEGRELTGVDAYAAAVRWWGGLDGDVREAVCRGPIDDARTLLETAEDASVARDPFIEAIGERCDTLAS
jgi:hypothetical protein